ADRVRARGALPADRDPGAARQRAPHGAASRRPALQARHPQAGRGAPRAGRDGDGGTGEEMKRTGKRYALVTGAARRLGREIALRLAGSGHFVFVHYRSSRREAESLLAEIRTRGGDGALVAGDLSTAAGAAAIVRAVGKKLGPGGKLHALVNNVGVYKVGPLLRFSPDDFDAVLRANLTACWRLIHGLLPRMPRGAGIVNIGYAGVEALSGTTHNTT